MGTAPRGNRAPGVALATGTGAAGEDPVTVVGDGTAAGEDRPAAAAGEDDPAVAAGWPNCAGGGGMSSVHEGGISRIPLAATRGELGAAGDGLMAPGPAQLVPATIGELVVLNTGSNSKRKSRLDEGRGAESSAKGKEDSSNVTWQEIIIRFVARLRQR